MMFTADKVNETSGVRSKTQKPTRSSKPKAKYTFFVCASVFLYLVTWFVLSVTNSEDAALGPQDTYKFKDIVLIGILVGAICIVWFHAVLETPNEQDKSSIKGEPEKESTPWFQVIIDYFKSWPLYQVTFLYFASRMVSNISLVYIPLYLVETIEENPEYIAIIPLVSYIASFVASLFVRQIRAYISSRTNYMLGSIVTIIGCVWLGYGITYVAELFVISILLGAGISITGVASLCLCADLIGTDTKNGAFVYSIVTAADKFFGGVVIIIIEEFKTGIFEGALNYHQNVLAYGCGVFMVFGMAILFTLYCGGSNARIEINESCKTEKQTTEN